MTPRPPAARRPSLWPWLPLAMLALAAADTTTAQAPEAWQAGLITAGPGASWWWRAQADGAEALVTTVPPGLGRAICVAPEDEPQTCVVVARGPWLRVIADGVVIGERVLLPVVTLPSTAGPEGAGAERERERPAAEKSASMEFA